MNMMPFLIRATGFILTLCLFGIFAESVVAQETKTPQLLFSAAQTGDIETVKSLLDDGMDVNATTKYGATALSFAAEKGNLELVTLLVDRGAELSPQDTFYNATPLTWANMNGHKEVAAFLKEKGAQPTRLALDKKKEETKPEEKPAGKSEGESEKSEARDDESAKTGEMEKEETVDSEPVVFPPDSAESRMADRAVSSSNWPQFRGTGARGIADGQNPPVEWNVADDVNVLWKTPIDGLGHSCPVIWEDKIFLTTAISGAGDTSIKAGNYGGVTSVDDESEHQFMTLCVDKNLGEIVWQQESAKGIPLVKRHLKSTHANPTVATNGKFVISFFAGQGLYCYTTDGELVWKKDLGMLDSGWFYDKSYQWGFGSSPVIFEETVIVQCDIQENSFVAAYRLDDGSEVWKTDRDEIPSWSSPNVVDSPRGPMLLTHATGFARGYDARTGEEWWRFGKHSEIVVPTPFVSHDMIYVTSGYSPIQPIIAISLDATGDVTLAEDETSSEYVRWYQPRGGPYMPSPIVYGDYMYLCSNDGRLTCLDAKTGVEVYKKRLSEGFDEIENKPEELGARMSFVGSPVAADGNIYFPEESGFVIVLAAGPEFRLVAINPIGEYVLTTPAISEGVFYVRGQQHLFAFGNKGAEEDE